MATSEPVIFNTVIEGARKAYGRVLTPELLAKLRAKGLDFEKPNAAYPIETFLIALAVIADAVAPGKSFEEQHRQIGRDFMYGYMQTAIGFAMLSMAKVLGAKRTLLRFGRNLKTTGNYVETEVQDLSEREVNIITRVLPEFRQHITPRWRAIAQYRVGIIEAALDILKADGVVTLIEPTPDETHFGVKWKPR
jgi:uncharacterized protein (TIGR02265 family)